MGHHVKLCQQLQDDSAPFRPRVPSNGNLNRALHQTYERSSLEWLIWFPVVEGWATLTEVQTSWTLEDCLKAVEARNVQAEVEHLKQKHAPKPRR
jgi:hypothetical protein